MVIPRKIFQTWKEKNVSNPILKQWQNSWTEKNTGYDYTLFDDEDNRNFIKTNFPQFLETYDGYDVMIKRADVVRYFYLYLNGGIYADLDFQCLKSFDDLLQNFDVDNVDVAFGSLGKMDTEKYTLHSVPNAIMIAKPKSDFFKFVIDVLMKIGVNHNLEVETATGPIFLFLCLIYYLHGFKNLNLLLSLYGKDIFDNIEHGTCNIVIVEPHVFYPINWNNAEHKKYYNDLKTQSPEHLFPNSHAVTYWMHSW